MMIFADLEQFRRICILSLLMIFSATALAQHGVVQGHVVDTKGDGVVGISVSLIHSQGEEKVIKAGENGVFVFEDVEPGIYILKVQKLDGITFVDPPGGFVELEVRRDQVLEFIFTIDNRGVIIDFGDPPTNGGGGPRPKRFHQDLGSLKPLSLSLRGMEKHMGEKPMTIQWTGQIQVPGHEQASVQIAKALLSQNYALGSLRFEDLGDNRFTLTLKASGWPGFAYDGDLAMLYLKIESLPGFKGELDIRTEQIQLLSTRGVPMDKTPFQQPEK